MRGSSLFILAACLAVVAPASSYTIPPNGVTQWWLDDKYGSPNDDCVYLHKTTPWVMLSAFRAGGKEGVHWKYTDDPEDPVCLENWKYYEEDGWTLKATVVGRTTLVNSKMGLWCGLPVYRSEGVLGKQWDYCEDTYFTAAEPTTAPPTIRTPTTAPTPTRVTSSLDGTNTNKNNANFQSSESKTSNLPWIVGVAAAAVGIVAVAIIAVAFGRKSDKREEYIATP